MKNQLIMEEKLIAAIIGLATGGLSYWISTFWMKPILHYRELRNQVLIDLIFYAQVVNAEGLNEQMQKLFNERIQSNRRLSAELTACALELPALYRWWLLRKGHMPERAAIDLLGFSNTYDYDAAAKRVEQIKAALGINSEAV